MAAEVAKQQRWRRRRRAGVSARLAAPTRARAGPRAGLRPAPQAQGHAGRRAPPAPASRPGARSPASRAAARPGPPRALGAPAAGAPSGRRQASRDWRLGTRPATGFLPSAVGSGAGRVGEAVGVWRKNGPGRPGCPAGRGLQGPRRRGPGRRVGPAQVAACAPSGAELVAARECARGQGGVTAVDKCVKSNHEAHLCDQAAWGVMAKGGRGRRRRWEPGTFWLLSWLFNVDSLLGGREIRETIIEKSVLVARGTEFSN